ncbi:MAG: hypothetical protein M3033_10670, partial [Acidobacteriota bacterium]|nr:hypothetical protein [Acidobacteriota bacterium]
MLNKIAAFLMFVFLFVNFADAQKKNAVQTKKKIQPKISTALNRYVEEREEYAVYEAVIKEKFGDKKGRFVVINKKVSGCGFIVNETEKNDMSPLTFEELDK